MNKDKLAFPCPEDNNYDRVNGMTLRDYFAAKAMQSLIILEQDNINGGKIIPVAAYNLADKMIEAREARDK